MEFNPEKLELYALCFIYLMCKIRTNTRLKSATGLFRITSFRSVAPSSSEVYLFVATVKIPESPHTGACFGGYAEGEF